jgi:uncharacterized repeat protein (TIGR03803 family)
VQDTAGNLYGTTFYGGADSFGVVFKLDATDKETVLLSFNRADGAGPIAGLARDAQGNLYGTTDKGAEQDAAVPAAEWSSSSRLEFSHADEPH